MSISCICLSGFAPLPDRASTGLPGPLQGSSEIMRSYVCGELAFIPLEFPRAEALKWPPNLLQNYLPSQDGMTHNQFIKVMIIFSIAFITVLILKVSGPRPTAQGGVMGLCCSSASCEEAGKHVCPVCLACCGLQTPALPTPAPLTPHGILRDPRFRASGL